MLHHKLKECYNARMSTVEGEGKNELVPTPLSEIVLQKGNTEVEVLTEGAMIASFTVGGEEVILRDQYFQTERGLKRRGGIPPLWPQCGPITEETALFNLSQHGFARNSSWEVVNFNQEAGAVTLRLESNEQTREMFPYDFELNYTISVEEGGLRAELSVQNNSTETLPMAPGFHPYLRVEISDKPNIVTNIPGFDPKTYDWKTPQPYPMQHPATIQLPGGQVLINASGNLEIMQVWSEPNRPHVCFEPWVGDVNAILHEDERINIPPGETASVWMEIKFEKTQQ